MSRWQALVLAGSRGPADPVAQASGVAHKAFAPVAGRAMIAHVLDALAAVPEIGRIAVSIAREAPALPETAAQVLRLDAGPGPAASAGAAFRVLGAPLLIATADHPLLTPAMARTVIAAAEAGGADALAGICPRAVAERAGNPAPRTWIRFADGDASGANLFALTGPRAAGALTLWEAVEADRKRPWRIARRIGAGALAAYLAGRLDRAGAARAIGRAAGCSAAFVAIEDPDAAHDVDRPADLAFAEVRLAARRGGVGR